MTLTAHVLASLDRCYPVVRFGDIITLADWELSPYIKPEFFY